MSLYERFVEPLVLIIFALLVLVGLVGLFAPVPMNEGRLW